MSFFFFLVERTWLQMFSVTCNISASLWNMKFTLSAPVLHFTFLTADVMPSVCTHLSLSYLFLLPLSMFAVRLPTKTFFPAAKELIKSVLVCSHKSLEWVLTLNMSCIVTAWNSLCNFVQQSFVEATILSQFWGNAASKLTTTDIILYILYLHLEERQVYTHHPLP